MPEKLSDYGTEFEAAVLKLALFDEPIARKINRVLSPDLFKLEQHKLIVTEYINATKTAGFAGVYLRIHLSIKTALSNAQGVKRNKLLLTLGQLTSLKRNPITTQDRDTVLDKLQEFVKKQTMHTSLITAIAHYEAGDIDLIAPEIAQADKLSKGIVTPSPGIDYGDYTAKLKRYARGVSLKARTSTGIKLLDDTMLGGVEPQTLCIVIGPTGRGKTLALVHLGAQALVQAKNVVHITLELSADIIEARYDAHLTGVPINALRSDTKKHYAKLLSISSRLTSKMYIKQWGSNEASISDVRSYLEMLKSAHGFNVDVLIVDYIDLLTPEKRSQQSEKRHELADLTRGLRQLAFDYDCIVWTASQTNKQSFNAARIRLGDVAESIDKVRIADVIIGLCATEAEMAQKKMRLLLLKNRLGGKENLEIYCACDAETQRITQTQNQPAGGITP